MPVTLPPDFARDVTETLRFYPTGAPARAFYQLVQADTPWRPGIPRLLVRAANRASVSTFEGERPLQVVLTGFLCPERAEFLIDAMQMLRRAAKDVAEGREPRLIYAHRDSLLVVGEGPGRWDTWDPPMVFGAPPGMRSWSQPSILDIHAKPPALPATEPTSPPAPAPAQPAASPGPRRPSFVTR
jgi:hypothetical protein